jgi:hypothetical protein
MKDTPAFPCVQPATSYKSAVVSYGMTLRDYFAAKAMQAMMSDPNLDMGCNTVATLSYRMADAMMKEREA